jgi:SAM-dependent methyltransferase
MAAHYGPKYHNAISAVGEEDADPRWQEHVGTVRRFKVSGALLDIGCNSGAFLAAIKNDGWKLSGIEIDPEVADRARSRTGAVVFPGDALSASFPAESFDAVTCFHVLEHQHHPFELMATVWRWLRPGGIFYVVVPNIDSWEARLFRSYWYGLEAPRHLYHFSVDSLRRCGVQAGFQVEELRTRSDCHIEASLQYVVNEVRRRLHRPALAPADAPRPGLASRIMQKAFYITILSPLAHVAAISGNGASISAVFKKTTHRS